MSLPPAAEVLGPRSARLTGSSARCGGRQTVLPLRGQRRPRRTSHSSFGEQTRRCDAGRPARPAVFAHQVKGPWAMARWLRGIGLADGGVGLRQIRARRPHLRPGANHRRGPRRRPPYSSLDRRGRRPLDRVEDRDHDSSRHGPGVRRRCTRARRGHGPRRASGGRGRGGSGGFERPGSSSATPSRHDNVIVIVIGSSGLRQPAASLSDLSSRGNVRGLAAVDASVLADRCVRMGPWSQRVTCRELVVWRGGPDSAPRHEGSVCDSRVFRLPPGIPRRPHDAGRHPALPAGGCRARLGRARSSGDDRQAISGT